MVVVETAEVEDLRVETGSNAELTVEEGDADDATTVSVTTGGDRVSVTCPPGTDVLVGNRSGRIELDGPLGDVHVVTTSGAVDIDEAESVDVRSRSGRVRVGCCHGRCRVMTKSGSVEIDETESLDVAVKSGRVNAEQVGEGRVYAASGSITLGATGEGDIRIRVLSGNVRIDVPPDVHPDVRARARSGKVRCDCPPGTDFVVDVATASGSVVVGGS